MDFRFNEAEQEMDDAFGAFVDKDILPHSIEVDQAGVFPAANYKKLAEFGYMGLGHEERWGGTNAGTIEGLIAQDHLARACPSTFLSAGASMGLFGGPVRNFASEEMQSEVLPGIVRGELIGAWALTEPHCGSDAVAMQTTARRTDTGYVLNGSKMFITNGMSADWVLVMAKTNPEAKHAGVSNFLVKKGTPGFTASQPLKKMGLRGSETAALYFEDCEIPHEWLVGEEGHGFIQAMKTLENGRLGMAAFGVGIAQAALDESIKYAKQREAFGKQIIKFQPVHFKLADMKVLVDGARTLMHRVAWLHDQGKAAQSQYSAAKLFATEAACTCTDLGVQIHGGYGYMAEYRIEHLFRDARLGPIGEGTSEIQRRLMSQETQALFA